MAAANFRQLSDILSHNEFTFLNYSSMNGYPLYVNHHEMQPAVRDNASWSYAGPLLQPSAFITEAADGPFISDNFSEFERATFTATILPSFLPFLKFINDFLSTNNLNHYFLTVRATKQTEEFDLPRWHTDDLFFDSDHPDTPHDKHVSQTDWKICTTLLGPPTLFISQGDQLIARKIQKQVQEFGSTDHVCRFIRCVGCASAAEVVRDSLAVRLAHLGVETAEEGQCAVFRVGRDRGAMHSEPRMSCLPYGRIFVNVVPARREELQCFMQKWGMEFPRHWWIGSVLRQHKHTIANTITDS